MSSITASRTGPVPVATPAPTAADAAYQLHSLQGVSRTFALTIPQLPDDLRQVVGNAYLLCRIADTIEDDKELPADRKRHFAGRFTEVVAGREAAAAFSRELAPILSAHTPAAERELIANTDSVIRITHSFNARQRAALERCVRIMAEGMARYQEAETVHGLEDLPDMDRYCYYVAGVVGEMLTELFCDYSPAIDCNRKLMMELAVSFGQGLQMTNILKDIWDDHRRGACWLPRAIFDRYGVELSRIGQEQDQAAFARGLEVLIGVAHGHLANAMRYTLLIPANETGLRKFCLWALGMAMLTLRRIHRHRYRYRSGNEVKISRRSVKATIFLSNAAVRRDNLLNLLFKLAGRGLPGPVIHEKIAS